MIPEKEALDKLSLCYENAQATDTPDIFVLVLYKVMTEYDTNDNLELTGRLIDEQQKKVLAPLNTLDQQVKKEMREVYDAIKAFVAAQKIINPIVLEELSIFEYSEQLPAESGLVTNQGQLLTLKCALLCFTGKTAAELNFLRQFAVINGKGEVESFTFIPSFSEWEKEENKIKNTKETQVWYAWHMLVAFYQAHNPKTYAKTASMKEFKHYLTMVFDFTKQELFCLENLGSKPIHMQNLMKKDEMHYDQAQSVLHVWGEKIPVVGHTHQGELLGLFFPHGKPSKEEIPIDTIHKDVFQTYADIDKKIGKPERDQVYGAIRELNRKTEGNCKIQQPFFIARNTYYKINPELFI